MLLMVRPTARTIYAPNTRPRLRLSTIALWKSTQSAWMIASGPPADGITTCEAPSSPRELSEIPKISADSWLRRTLADDIEGGEPLQPARVRRARRIVAIPDR